MACSPRLPLADGRFGRISAGADPGRYVRAILHRWLAVTDATIVADEGSGHEVGVLLVNMDHVART